MPIKGEFFQKPTGGAASFYDHQIAQSCRFDRGSSSVISRTNSSPSNQKKWTLSFWLKFTEATNTTASQCQMVVSGTSGSQYFFTTFRNNEFKRELTGTGYLTSSALFRDPNAWNHFIYRVDTTQSTASDRERLYLNGNIVAWGTTQGPNYIAQNNDYGFVTQNSVAIAFGGISGVGHGTVGTSHYLAEFILTDGQSYAPTQFGESKNGVWIPKDPDGTTFGNNGFHLKFENASDLGNDSSGNNNDFTAAGLGADHQVLDSPTFGS